MIHAFRRFALGSLAALPTLVFAAPTLTLAAPTLRIADGVLAGTREGDIVRYLGIPYAAAPTGANRWRAPQAVAPWAGTRQATSFGPSCPQTVTPEGFGPWTREYVIQGPVDEDCLSLNVWAPAGKASGKHPVMLWIYGGGFSSGGAAVDIYDGRALAAQGIVVVSVNYRVGVYGFLAHPELAAENPQHASGNYGLLDQVAALRWVQKNIAAFGGDPHQVTIAGQSAGAASVHHLIASPLAKGLFQRAIAQSGSGMGLSATDHATAEAEGKAFVSKLGVHSIAALRGLSVAELDAAMGRSAKDSPPPRFGPSIDGLLLPTKAFADTNTNDTPILTGMTANEGTGLNPAYGRATADSFRTAVQKTYGALAPALLARYPAQDDASANAAVDALARERGLAAMALWARQRVVNSRQPLYLYLWTHAEPGHEAARYKAFHSSEIPYVFGRLDTRERPFTDADRALSQRLSAQWVRFVKTGDPNGPGLPAWPRYTGRDARLLEIDVEPRIREILPTPLLQLFEQHVAAGGRVGIL